MKFAFSIMALLALMATGASAVPDTNLHTTCEPGELVGDGITAAEFRIENMPVSGPPNGLITWTWSTQLVIGDVYNGIALAWSEVQVGPWVLMGTAQLYELLAAWAGPDTKLRVAETLDSVRRAVVDGGFNTLNVPGMCFWLNCASANCICDVNAPVEDASWGSIKSLY